jgi:hypothetical protein
MDKGLRTGYSYNILRGKHASHTGDLMDQCWKHAGMKAFGKSRHLSMLRAR